MKFTLVLPPDIRPHDDYGGLANGFASTQLALRALAEEGGPLPDLTIDVIDNEWAYERPFNAETGVLQFNQVLSFAREARRFPFPTALHWHGWFITEDASIWPDYKKWPERDVLLNLADVVVFSSRALRGFADLGGKQEGEVVWNCVNPKSFYPAQRPGAGLCAIINLTYDKGLDRLANLEEMDVVGSRGGSGRWVEPAENLNIYGPIAHGDVPSFLRSHEILLHPSRVESCSLTIIEAMACGLPVVCTSAGDSTAMVGDAGVALETWTRAAAREAVARIRADYDSYRVAALEQSKLFAPERIGEQLWTAYQKAMINFDSKVEITRKVQAKKPTGTRKQKGDNAK